MVKAYSRREWHGTWTPIEAYDYDDFSEIAGPDIQLVGFEQRCGATFPVTAKGIREAEKHETICEVCMKYKRSK